MKVGFSAEVAHFDVGYSQVFKKLTVEFNLILALSKQHTTASDRPLVQCEFPVSYLTSSPHVIAVLISSWSK